MLPAGHKAGGGQFADLLAVETGLELEIELFQGLEPGEAGLAQTGFLAALGPALPLDRQGFGQEGLVVQFTFGRLFTDGLQLGFQIIHLQFGEQAGQFHDAASS